MDEQAFLQNLEHQLTLAEAGQYTVVALTVTDFRILLKMLAHLMEQEKSQSPDPVPPPAHESLAPPDA